MKNRLILSCVALAAMVGCTKYTAEDPIAYIECNSVASISTSETTCTVNTYDEYGEVDGSYVDYSIEVTITAPEGTSYYSYLVVEGEQSVNASSLFTVTYSGLASATAKYTADSPSTVINLGGLASDTQYTVYAVVANEQSNVGEVVSQSITTSNYETPYISNYYFDEDECVVYIYYSEAVALSSDAEIEATVRSTYLQQEMYSFTIESSKITVYDEYTIQIAVPQGYANSMVSLEFESGFVYNNANTPSSEISSPLTYQFSPVNFNVFVGVVDADQVDGVSLDADGNYAEHDGTTQYFTTDASEVVVFFTDGTEISGFGKDEWMQAVVYDGSTTSYTTLTAGETIYSSSNSEGQEIFIFAESGVDVSYGAYLNFVFEEGAFYDEYGNTNNALTSCDYLRSSDR